MQDLVRIFQSEFEALGRGPIVGRDHLSGSWSDLLIHGASFAVAWGNTPSWPPFSEALRHPRCHLTPDSRLFAFQRQPLSIKRIIAVPSATGELRKMGAAAHFRLSWRLDNPGNSLVLCLYTGTLNPFNGCLHELMFGQTLDTSDKSLTSRFSMQFGVAKWGVIFFGVPLPSFSFWGGSLIAKGFALGFNLTSNSILGIHPTSDSC